MGGKRFLPSKSHKSEISPLLAGVWGQGCPMCLLCIGSYQQFVWGISDCTEHRLSDVQLSTSLSPPKCFHWHLYTLNVMSENLISEQLFTENTSFLGLLTNRLLFLPLVIFLRTRRKVSIVTYYCCFWLRNQEGLLLLQNSYPCPSNSGLITLSYRQLME